MKTTGHVQFKPSSVMAIQLKVEARRWGVSVNQFAKNIIAMGLNGIDVKLYSIIQLMARANNNLDTFEECACHIGAFLKGYFEDVDEADDNRVNTVIIIESNKYIEARKAKIKKSKTLIKP